MKPSNGRIVHYNKDAEQTCCVGIIIHVNDDETVNLVVFDKWGASSFVYGAKEGEGHTNYRWPHIKACRAKQDETSLSGANDLTIQQNNVTAEPASKAEPAKPAAKSIKGLLTRNLIVDTDSPNKGVGTDETNG